MKKWRIVEETDKEGRLVYYIEKYCKGFLWWKGWWARVWENDINGYDCGYFGKFDNVEDAEKKINQYLGLIPQSKVIKEF